MDKHLLSLCLAIFGPLGLLILLTMAFVITRQYRGNRIGGFRWQMRNLRMKQFAAITCLFCIAMAASYGVLQEAWAILYLIIAFKTGTWWLRFAINQRS